MRIKKDKTVKKQNCITTERLKGKSDRRKFRNKVHLLVMIAERVWKTKFWNVHQSSFSIPGMRRRGKRKQLRPRFFPKWWHSTLRDNAGEKPPPAPLPPACTGMLDSDGLSGRVCAWACVCCVCVCVYVYMCEREKVSECV